MSTIKTEVHEINETRKEVSVDVAAAEIANIHKQLVNEFQREAKIPGFRSGKAPENVILTRFAKELKSELAKRVINMAYQEGVGKLDFEVFSVVESNEVEVAPDKNVSVSFTVDVLQEFELPDYEGLKLTVKPTEPTAEEIDTVVKQMLSQRAEFNTVEKTVEKGDYVKCSYEGKIGEELIAEIVPDKPMWGTQKNTWEEAGTDQPYGVPVIIEGLVGMKAGDKKEVPMDFPEDFEFEALAGKKGIYSVEVEEVREKILPEMDEAFFKSMQLKDEAELRTRI
ncbi:MAG: trigger factor, partial [Lentimonas sp.]